MADLNVNSSAFPTVEYKQSGGMGVSVMEIKGGMTLRDYFAAKAMQAFCNGLSDIEGYSSRGLAIMAYDMADAMLKERGE